jgi:transposase
MARTDLPSSIEALRGLVVQQQALLDEKQSTIETQAEKIAYLEEWKRLIDSQRFASKSEKVSTDQFPLFNEVEVEAAASADTREEDAISVPAHTRKKRGRRPLPEFLPVREVLHDLSDEEKVCPHDASHTMKEIGRETSDQLEFIPARVEVVRNVRPKYACPTCKEGVRVAPMRHRHRSRRASRRPLCWPRWRPRSTWTVFHSTGRRRSSSAWGSISRGPRWRTGW